MLPGWFNRKLDVNKFYKKQGSRDVRQRKSKSWARVAIPPLGLSHWRTLLAYTVSWNSAQSHNPTTQRPLDRG